MPDIDWTVVDSALGITSRGRFGACILIATKDGAGTIFETIKYASGNADVFLVSDGSTDATVAEAWRAGAVDVLHLDVNIGKPSALREAFNHFGLADRYEFICVLDDDTRLDPHFMHEALKPFDGHPEVVAVSGRTLSDWGHEQRWNGWVAARAMSYARYDLFVKRGQSALNAITVLPGSNSVFRTDTFGELLARDVRYIVDDTQWLLDIQTEGMGRVVHTHHAKAWVQDPSNLRDYYRQMLRWMWGSFQGVRGHRIGRRLSWFSLTYSLLIVDWVLYVTVWPALLAWVSWRGWQSGNLDKVAMFYFGGYFVWTCLFAVMLRKWRLPLLLPWIIALDWINRFIFIRAFVKAWRQPVVESCRWDSPTRLSTRREV